MKIKKTNFLGRLSEIPEQADIFIKAIPEGKLILLFEDEDEQGLENDINEMPIVTRVDKYNNYDEFAIISIQKEKGEINMKVIGKGDASDEERTIDYNGLYAYWAIDIENTCQLADAISTYFVGVNKKK